MTVFAKISRPRLPEVFPRERLFAILDVAAQRPLVWIAAPPGAGKTTLVESWLDARKFSALWYSLDAGDGDLASFFYYLGKAVKHAAPRHRKPLPLFTPEYQFGLSVFSKRFFESLFSRIKPPAVLVFDNYQEIPLESPIHGALRDGLEAVPKGVTVVFVSREAPVAAMARQKAGGKVATLGWGDLKLTLDESKGLAGLHGKNEEPPSTLRHYHDTVDGWAAGLVLMLAGAGAGSTEHPPRAEAPLQDIFDYYAGELFEKADDDMREFLLSTAFFPSMTASMAERLSGVAASKKILSYLCRNHYFTEMHAKDTPVYQYHPLFRAFLLSRASESFLPQELKRVQRSAAALLAEEGQTEDAVALLREAEDWHGYAALVLGQTQSLMTQGRHQTLQEWIEAVPQEIVEHTPWLLFWRGACRLPVDPNGARDCFETALAGFDADADSAGVFMAWSFAVDSFLLDPSGVARLDHWIALIDELMMRYPLFPSPIIEAHVYTGIIYALAIRQPQRPETGEWAKRALALSVEIQDPQLYGKTAQVVIFYHILSGDLPAAKMVIEPLRESIAYRGTSPPLPFITLKYFEALYCWLSAQPESSLAHVSEALLVAQTTGVHLLDFLLYGQGANAALSQGELETARDFLGKMAPVLGSARRNDISYYYHLTCWYSLLRGDIVGARAEAEEALKLAVECGSPFAEGLCYLMLAHVLHMSAEPRKAVDFLARAHHIGGSMKSSLIEFPAHLFDALFAFDRGDEAAGLDCLRTALAIGRDKGLMNFDGWHPVVIARLCAKALENGIETEYVREMIRRRKLTSVADGMPPENWPWPLQISTLGRFELLTDGEPVVFSGKVQQKPLLMLKTLIALGGREVPEERISDLLWPDVDGDQARKNFEINLLRLRRLLGNDRYLLLRERRLTLNGKYCYVDTWALETVIGEAETIWRDGSCSPHDAERLMNKLFALYKGHFLATDANHPWMLSTRERLRSKFIHFVEKMGRYLEENGAPEQAVDCYLKGLEVDDSAEEFYQGLMACYEKLGRTAKAHDVYNRCRIVLAAKLGIKPSAKTKAIYQALHKSL